MAKCLVFMLLLALCSASILQAKETPVDLLRPDIWTLQPPVNALGPIPANGSWKTEGKALVATGTAAPWTMQTAGEKAWTDYELAVKVTIRRPGPKADYPIFYAEFDRYLPREQYPPLAGHSGIYRYRYYAGEFDWGSEAAVFVRYQDRNNCYRVQLSTEYQEIILWHGTGGYLQVVPCKLEPGKTYDLRVRAQGAHLQVLLDGKKKIDYWHECLPTLSGGIGLGAYRSTVAFAAPAVTSLPAAGPMPVHKAQFSLRPWRTLIWLFDGNEPIAMPNRDPYVSNGGYIEHVLYYHFVKLRPGYRPQYYCWMAALIDGHATAIASERDIKATGVGTDRLTLQFDTLRPDGSVKAHHTNVLTYDRVRGTYRHDLAADLTFLKEMKLSSLEFIDPLDYNNKEPGKGVQHPWLTAGHQWSIFTGKDGKLYRQPMSEAYLMYNGWKGARDRSIYMLYPNRAVCPVWETNTTGEAPSGAVCHWGYDYHHSFHWDKPRTFKAGETFSYRYALSGCRMEEAERLFTQSTLDPIYNDVKYLEGRTFMYVPDVHAFPICEPGGNDFRDLATIRQPFVGFQWTGDYAMDRQVGHGDRYSMRLDGPTLVTGLFYHHMLDSYAKRYLCNFWVKTRGVRGKLTATLKYSFGPAPTDTLDLGLTGDNDWTQVSFISTVPVATMPNYDSSDFILTLAGTGTVWFDDWSVRPLTDGETGIEHRPGPVAVVPPTPLVDYLVYLRGDAGTGVSCFDSSGHNNHAKLHGVTWVNAGKRPVMRFADNASAFIPNLSPELLPGEGNLYQGKALTIDAWIRPAAGKGGGSLVGIFNSPRLYLSPAGGKFALTISVAPAGKGISLSTPATIPADLWTHVAATIDEKDIARLYVGGKPVVEKELGGKITARGWGWYPAISIGTYAKAFGGAYTGDLAEVRWWSRAATDAEIAAAAATPPDKL
ncbi:MAG: LamG-like jellyroll fold domain-containing protein [Armatimonadota bacterium]